MYVAILAFGVPAGEAGALAFLHFGLEFQWFVHGVLWLVDILERLDGPAAAVD